MEIRQYFVLLRRWAWLIALGLLIGIIGGYIFSKFQTPVYRASTKVLITQSADSSLSQLVGTNQGLSETYAELLLTRPVIQATGDKLGYPVFKSQVAVQSVRNTNVVLLTADDNDPQRAADIANTVVSTFLEQNNQLQSTRFAESEQSLQQQIQRIQEQITTLEQEMNSLSEEGFNKQQQAVTSIIANLQNEINSLNNDITKLTYDYPLVDMRDPNTYRMIQVTATPSVEQRTELTTKETRLGELQQLLNLYQQIYVNLSVASDPTQSQSNRTDQLRAALNLYQQIYSNLLSNYETIRLSRYQNAPNVLQVEPATPPNSPVRPQPLINMAVGGMLGLLLSAGAIALKEGLNNTLRTPEDVVERLDVPVLGYISEMPEENKDGATAPFVLLHPRSPISEAFRTLRTNLQFAEVEEPLHTMLISSQGSEEGKTTIAVNLAVVIAQTGKRVVLIDADLRRPKVHHALGLPNRVGLSNLLRENISPENVFQRYKMDSLMVVTSGSLPPNPAEVLSSNRMLDVLKQLSSMADMVILDGPPLVFADSVALAANVNGVLMVIRPNKTVAQAAVSVVDQLNRVGARLVGVVLNMIKQESSPLYSNYRTYARYSVDGSDPILNEVDETKPVRVRQ